MDGSQRPRPPPPTVANQPQRPFITAPGVAYVTGAAAMYGRASPTGYYDAQGRWFAYPGAPYATAAAAPYAAAAAAPYSAGYPAPSYAAVAGSAYVNVGAAPASATASTTPPKPAFTAVTFRPQSTIPARKKLINATPAVHAVQTAMPLRPLSVSQSGAGSGTASASSSTASPEWPDSLKNFVTRIFERAGVANRAQVSAVLRDYIRGKKESGTLWTTDWANIVVPELEAVLRPKMKRAADEDGADIAPSAQQQQRLPPTKQLKRAHQGNVFSRMAAASQPPHASASGNDELEHWDQAPIVGTSQRLEKRYLRLTSAPDPTTVRPLPVLRQTMALLKRKWKAERDYGYICDQFKSVRQDLTVQMVRNEFTVEVYEVHARIALEKHDLGEYNQCQSQLAQLYGAGIAGHRMEFMAYRLLYFLYTKNRAGVYRFLKELTEAEKQDPAVKHALDVRKALASSNYHALFQLYLNSVNMSAYLMDKFVERERVAALITMCRAYRPSLELSFIAKELGFLCDDECRTFIDGMVTVDIGSDDDEEVARKKQRRAALPLYTDKKRMTLDTKAAVPFLVHQLTEKFGKVDIKGQI